MTIGGSIALIVIGAILRFGVTWKPKYLDLEAIGVILMVAGVAGPCVSVALVVSSRRGRAATEGSAQRRYIEPPHCRDPPAAATGRRDALWAECAGAASCRPSTRR